MDENMTVEELQRKLKSDTEVPVEQPIKTEEPIEEVEQVEQPANIAVVEEPTETVEMVEPVQPQSKFEQAMDAVKLNVLAEAAAEDEQFVRTVKQSLKSAAVSNTQVEEKKADLEKKKVDFQAATVDTQMLQNEHQAVESKWANREKKRQYHYNGVKPIMQFAGINEPLNLFLLYLLTLILMPFFLLAKLLRGTVGILLGAACDPDKPKSIKGLLWTILAVGSILITIAVVYLFLKWQGLI